MPPLASSLPTPLAPLPSVFPLVDTLQPNARLLLLCCPFDEAANPASGITTIPSQNSTLDETWQICLSVTLISGLRRPYFLKSMIQDANLGV